MGAQRGVRLSPPPEVHFSWEKHLRLCTTQGTGSPVVSRKIAGVPEAQGMYPVSPPWPLASSRGLSSLSVSLHVDTALLRCLCYTWHLTELSYPEELLKAGLPRLRKQPRLPSRMCVLSLEHRFPWREKPKTWKGEEGIRCNSAATWSTPLGQERMVERNCLGGAE